ncbi:MAG: Uncharacterized protein XD43_0435 [Thermococcales archaeon 44_46]|jgi:hypothetical protein|uniref:hypothetical protein n=1 Tax=Thermococcus sp. 101 C5 TaxID=2654197 RepID=UPI000748F8A6|nr:hypothetical protein [Thermococcus sp. 101 C5]KUJ99903.1 MAG: Uncharacterized protein XD43_0435 [Thermococcales archaeon 44_46]MDK2783163.1 hypothetical protein [Thermococcaceae archaeon]MDK2982795.1 hypothetical protein [Thermococcaceae archaeon]MPW39235.1 hypothetical protein [Thermococcus sp. 101 C5]HIH72043.1 hypothetical protein [Thermococcaceae archaeon]
MKEHKSAIFFLILASPLWILTIIGITELAQHYPNAIDNIPLVRVHYDPISGRYLLSGAYELVYPTFLLSVLTLAFLWKTRVSPREFGVLALTVPLITLVFAFAISSLSGHSDYSDSGPVLIFGAYIMPVVSFLLGVALYQALRAVRVHSNGDMTG